MYVIRNGKYYYIKRDLYEPYEHFILRCNFIINQYKNYKKYDELIALSKIIINIKYYGLKYNKNIMDKINNFDLSITI